MASTEEDKRTALQFREAALQRFTDLAALESSAGRISRKLKRKNLERYGGSR
jgi:hypothetical protein